VAQKSAKQSSQVTSHSLQHVAALLSINSSHRIKIQNKHHTNQNNNKHWQLRQFNEKYWCFIVSIDHNIDWWLEFNDTFSTI